MHRVSGFPASWVLTFGIKYKMELRTKGLIRLSHQTDLVSVTSVALRLRSASGRRESGSEISLMLRENIVSEKTVYQNWREAFGSKNTTSRAWSKTYRYQLDFLLLGSSALRPKSLCSAWLCYFLFVCLFNSLHTDMVTFLMLKIKP